MAVYDEPMGEYVQPGDYVPTPDETARELAFDPDMPGNLLEAGIAELIAAHRQALRSPELRPHTGILPIMQLGIDAMAMAVEGKLIEPEELFAQLTVSADVMGHLLLQFLDDPDTITIEQKQRLVIIAEILGPDWCQALYHQAVFMTKVV